MAENQDGLAFAARGEINLQLIAGGGGFMNLDAAADGRKFCGEKSSHLVERVLMVAGRFDLNSAADPALEFRLAWGEPGQEGIGKVSGQGD
jgi:hypothetical protein